MITVPGKWVAFALLFNGSCSYISIFFKKFILSKAKVLLCREKDPLTDLCNISGSLRDFAWPLASQFTFSSIRQGSNSTAAPKGVPCCPNS